jgi:uncharacterized repeat protein (TIGR01451 family)
MAVVLMLLTTWMAGAAAAKSLYVITEIVRFDMIIPIHAYDIGPDGTLTFQAEHRAPMHGAGMVGIAMDSDSGYLFVTYEDLSHILMIEGKTLVAKQFISAPDATNLAGIVYDHEKKLLYCVDRNTSKLFSYQWDWAATRLTPAPGSPFNLEGAQAFGIALDELNDWLYVAGPGQGIRVYSTEDWRLVRTISTNRLTISVAVDQERGYLYYGGGFMSDFHLTRIDLADESTKEILIDPEAGVIGLGVDPATGFVYITTGNNRPWGPKDLMVFDPDLTLIQTIEDIGRPTGLVVPTRDTGYNPLKLTKTVTNALGGKPDDQGLYPVVIGDQVVYSICFEPDGHNLTEITIRDRLPAELVFVDAAGDGTFGQYDPAAHTYTWQNPPLAPTGKTCLELVCRLPIDTPAGTILNNLVTIHSDKTPPTTIRTRAIATGAAYHPLNLSKVVVSPNGTNEEGPAQYARPGDPVTYRICFDNRDNERAAGTIVLIDVLPQQVQFVSATDDGLFGQYDRDTHTYTWTYPSLAAGQTRCVDLVVRLDPDVPAGAVITNRATIQSDQTPQSNAKADLTVAFAPLEVHKTVLGPLGELDGRGHPIVRPGDTVTYAIQVHNPSRESAVTQVAVVDSLPPEMAFLTATGDGDFGAYDPHAHAFTWLYPALEPGAQVRLELAARVQESAPPDTVLRNVVTAAGRQTAPGEGLADVVTARSETEPKPDPNVVSAQVFIRPTHLWRNHSQATPTLMVIVHLPEGHGKQTIAETPLALTPGNVRSSTPQIYGSDTQGKVLAYFDTDPILNATQGYGLFPIQVAGELRDGRTFHAQTTIAILKFGGP